MPKTHELMLEQRQDIITLKKKDIQVEQFQKANNSQNYIGLYC